MTRPTGTVVVVAICVLALHAAAMWALQVGLMARKPEVAAPVQLLARIVVPRRPSAPVPQPAPTQQSIAPRPSTPMRKPRAPEPDATQVAQKPIQSKPEPTIVTPPPTRSPTRSPTPTPAPAPAPEPEPSRLPALSEPAIAPIVPAATAAPGFGKPEASGQAAKPAPVAFAQAVVTAARPAQLPVELPSSDARYLQNPKPRYPPISRRLREQGTVLVDVLVSDQGLAREAKVQTSSGYFRLDNAAVSTVLTWRFVPGKRDGIALSMWFTVPVTFAIQ